MVLMQRSSKVVVSVVGKLSSYWKFEKRLEHESLQRFSARFKQGTQLVATYRVLL